MSSTSAVNSLLSSSSTSTSSAIDLSSILTAATGATSTGIDVTSAVDAAIYADRAPERQWQAEQTTVQSQITALGSIQSSLSTLSTDLNNLNDPLGALTAVTAASSNSSVLTAATSSGAMTGNHTITVQNLASSAAWYSSPLSTAASSVGSSTLQISQSDGTQTTFTLGANGDTSLTALASAINGASLGINASVVSDALGSRLALVSQSSGSASSFSVADVASPSSSSWTSASVASPSSSLAASTFQVYDGTSTTSISVAAGSSLSSVASQINGAGLNVSASVVTDASGAHLVIASANAGSVTVSSDPALLLTQSSAGTDASLTVDGVPVTSSSNAVSGAIPGVTLNLQGTSTSSPVTLSVSADTSQIDSTLSQFVTDYNSALSLVNAQFTYSTSTSSQGALGSDATVRSLQSALLSITGYKETTSGSSSVTSLASLGITVGDDGSLTLDSDTLNQALATNSSAALNFFQGSALNGFAATSTSALDTFSDPSTGVLTADVGNLTQQYNDYQTDINNFESGYIASQQTVLTTMYSNAEIALQQLPATMKEIQGELGNDSSGS